MKSLILNNWAWILNTCNFLFNDLSTFVGHFKSSPKETGKVIELVEEIEEDIGKKQITV